MQKVKLPNQWLLSINEALVSVVVFDVCVCCGRLLPHVKVLRYVFNEMALIYLQGHKLKYRIGLSTSNVMSVSIVTKDINPSGN